MYKATTKVSGREFLSPKRGLPIFLNLCEQVLPQRTIIKHDPTVAGGYVIELPIFEECLCNMELCFPGFRHLMVPVDACIYGPAEHFTCLSKVDITDFR